MFVILKSVDVSFSIR